MFFNKKKLFYLNKTSPEQRALIKNLPTKTNVNSELFADKRVPMTIDQKSRKLKFAKFYAELSERVRYSCVFVSF